MNCKEKKPPAIKQDITPMMRQYLEIKEKYLDCILFYRLGDFYEMFYEDAEIASKILDIALTSRNRKDPDQIPMCGIPVKSADIYLAKLVEANFKVAICEQTEDPALSKGLVKREVIRILTPGALIEEHLLDGKNNNFIVSLFFQDSIWGIASLDLSTGVFRMTETPSQGAVKDELNRILAKEILVEENFEREFDTRNLGEAYKNARISPSSSLNFSPERGKEILLRIFSINSLNSFGIKKAKAGTGAAGALLLYMEETQKQDISHISKLEVYNLEKMLLIDEVSFRNLELTESINEKKLKNSLFSIMNHCLTAMGSRSLRQWLSYPLLDKAEIIKRQEAIELALKEPLLRREIREKLGQIYDIERINTRISLKRCNPKDLLALKNSLFLLPDILSDLKKLNSLHFQTDFKVEKFEELRDFLEEAIREDAPVNIEQGDIIKQGFNEELDQLLKMSRDTKSSVAKLENSEKEKTGINTLKVGFNRVFGYFIEVSKAQARSVPENYIRKQTLVNAERYITEELKVFEEQILEAEEKALKLEAEIFEFIILKIKDMHKDISMLSDYISRLDIYFALAQLADENSYTRPEIREDGVIDIKNGRHPVVEKLLKDKPYVPNSIFMNNEDSKILIITGPNMGGKSTILRQLALIIIMAQMGSFVPAEKASLTLVDRIFTRIGASDNLASGQSTFMIEMEETANILNNAGPKSLVIMDEIGRGTSTFDGLSIVWAVAEYLHKLKNRGVKSLFATHYHEMTKLGDILPGVKNFSVAVREIKEDIIFLYKLVPGGANRSYGIQVAKLAGLPDSVINRAGILLSRLEQGKSLKEKDMDKQDTGQIKLFPEPESELIEIIKKLEPDTISPIEAMHILYKLKEKTVSLKSD